MLYEQWRQVAAARRGDFALREAASGRRWTFGELFAAGESFTPVPDDGMVFPQGHTPEFIFTLLAAWRSGKVVCPLETGQKPPVVALPPRPCVHLKTTSATTGAARFVAFTAEQLAADTANIVETMGLRPDWPNLGVISLAHSYGFSNLVLPLLLHGIPLVLGSAPLPEAVRLAAAGEEALTLPAVPAMWRAWHEAGVIPPNVRLALSAGAMFPVSLEQAIHGVTGLKVHNFYGSTECGGIAYDRGETPRVDDAFVGQAMHGVQLKVEDGGCLAVHSQAVGTTYWPESQGTLADGTFQTTDLVELQGGNVFLRGRASDLINVAGRKVSPITIETELNRHPVVSACVVFGVPSRDVDRGDLIVAAVVLRSTMAEGDLRQFLLDRLPAWQVPREWMFVEELTSNRLGKISRAEWRRRFAGQLT